MARERGTQDLAGLPRQVFGDPNSSVRTPLYPCYRLAPERIGATNAIAGYPSSDQRIRTAEAPALERPEVYFGAGDASVFAGILFPLALNFSPSAVRAPPPFGF